MRKLLLTAALLLLPITANAQTAKHSRDIYILGGIESGDAIASYIDMLNKESQDEIVIHISSPGGSVYAGLQIYDAMRLSAAPIRTVCESYCMSMAAILLASGDIRQAKANSTILVHGVAIYDLGGKLPELINEIREGIRLQNIIDRILVEHTGKPREFIQQIESYDDYMSPETAKEYGLIDQII